ncbi:MAG: DNA repair protein RecN [Prevotellaceae bacterium]|nr:DNA repair protein RecN [Prevotellaceae bacterium]
MIRHLYIRNFTIIEELDIDLFPGFSVITGETGAGKSIVLGAIGLLKGQRADSKMIRHGADRCVVEAHFDLSKYDMQAFFTDNDIDYDAADCIVRREITSAGKSRAFINDTPVSLAILKELGESLIDVHSQHQNLLLGRQDFQLSVVDIIADSRKELADYREAYALMKDRERELKRVKEEIETNRSKADFMQYQYDELDAAKLIDGEQDELEQKAERMSHSEEIKTALYEADNSLSADDTGAITLLRSARSALNQVEKVLPIAGELAARMDSAYIELKDIAQEISGQLEEVDFNPADLDSVNNRLDKIYSLEKKYHVESVGELIALRDELERQLGDIENTDERLNELQAAVDKATAKCRKLADILSGKRKKSSKAIQTEVMDRLVSLGMPNVRFEIQITQDNLSANGQDTIDFLFSANKNGTLQQVAQVASGGEIARLMLSLKAMISGAVKLPTIIFDEIDTGVSGKIAEKMAQIMKEMGDCERQVISITHLPQIAALGSTHYKVFKEDTADGTVSRMQLLTDDERINEIAQMLSGSNITEAAISNAKALLGIKN